MQLLKEKCGLNTMQFEHIFNFQLIKTNID